MRDWRYNNSISQVNHHKSTVYIMQHSLKYHVENISVKEEFYQ